MDQTYDCPKNWFPEAEAPLEQSSSGALLSVTGLLGLHQCSFVCVEINL